MNHVAATNGGQSSAEPAQVALDAVDYHVPKFAPATGKPIAKTASVSLVIPVRNEASNIAWVLEQITDDVDEIILVDGNSTGATLIAALSELRSRRRDATLTTRVHADRYVESSPQAGTRAKLHAEPL